MAVPKDFTTKQKAVYKPARIDPAKIKLRFTPVEFVDAAKEVMDKTLKEYNMVDNGEECIVVKK